MANISKLKMIAYEQMKCVYNIVGKDQVEMLSYLDYIMI